LAEAQGKPVRVYRVPHATDVPHLYVPYIKRLLECYDALIVMDYFGLECLEQFGERIIVDCKDYLGIRDVSGEPYVDKLEKAALALGLSVIVCDEDDACRDPDRILSKEGK
jgi:hypothetical protein